MSESWCATPPFLNNEHSWKAWLLQIEKQPVVYRHVYMKLSQTFLEILKEAMLYDKLRYILYWDF